MKKLIAFFFVTMNIGVMQAQTYKEWVRKADSCYAAKNYELSVSYYDKAFKIEKKDFRDLYNAGCSASMAKENKKAFKWLNLAIDNGYQNMDELQVERDLIALHSEKEWKKTIEKLQKKIIFKVFKLNQKNTLINYRFAKTPLNSIVVLFRKQIKYHRILKI